MHNDKSILNHHLAPWRPRKLRAISRGDVGRLHADLGQAGHPTWANRIVSLIRLMFNRAEGMGRLHWSESWEGHPVFPRGQARPLRAAGRTAPALCRPACRAEYLYPSGLAGALLTGARRSEVLDMQWAQIDFDQAVWRIPHTKAGRPHLLPLPKPVIELLRSLPRQDENLYVFCGYRKGRPLVNVSKPWKRIRRTRGVAGVRVHDLRRTLGRGSRWAAPAFHSSERLNHTNPSTTAIYSRLHLDPVRSALEINAEKMLSFDGSEAMTLPHI